MPPLLNILKKSSIFASFSNLNSNPWNIFRVNDVWLASAAETLTDNSVSRYFLVIPPISFFWRDKQSDREQSLVPSATFSECSESIDNEFDKNFEIQGLETSGDGHQRFLSLHQIFLQPRTKSWAECKGIFLLHWPPGNVISWRCKNQELYLLLQRTNVSEKLFQAAEKEWHWKIYQWISIFVTLWEGEELCALRRLAHSIYSFDWRVRWSWVGKELSILIPMFYYLASPHYFHTITAPDSLPLTLSRKKSPWFPWLVVFTIQVLSRLEG